jgi:hypothetical protein
MGSVLQPVDHLAGHGLAGGDMVDVLEVDNPDFEHFSVILGLILFWLVNQAL